MSSSPGADADAKTDDPEFERLVAAISGSVCKRATQRLETCLSMLDVKPTVAFHIHCKTPNDKTDLLDFLALQTLAAASDLPFTTDSANDGSRLTVNFYRSRAQMPGACRAQT